MSHERVGRRASLVGVGAGAAAIAVASLTGPRAARAEAPARDGATRRSERAQVELAHGLAPVDASVLTLLGPLAEGHPFSASDGSQWLVETAYAPSHGVVPLVLRARSALGVRVAVELCLDDPSSDHAPPARANGLAAYVANGGDGASATREQQGLAVMALMAAIAPRAEAVSARLVTHAERRHHVVPV